MPVQKNQQKPSNLPAQMRNPKNQSIKKAAKTNPVKNAKVTIVGAVVHTALAGAVHQQLP